MYEFNAKEVTEKCINWIREWFEENGKGCNAIIGISGGKDSSITASLCVKALGKERVFGLIMPNGTQDDLDTAVELCHTLNIDYSVVNIEEMYNTIIKKMLVYTDVSEQTQINLPARLRMTVLYATAQSKNGRVANTCNLSEDWVGYSTRYGDSAGDFSPLSRLTVTEVKAIGKELGLPSKFVDKTPTDGLCGKTDEDNLGFTYKMLDDYIRYHILPPKEIKDKIDAMHKKNLFKLQLMPCFEPRPVVVLN